MKLSERDRKALIGLRAAVCLVLILRYTVLSDAAPSQSADADSIAQAEQRVSRLRQLAALVPARATVVKQADADLADRERGLLQADTAAQAQAALLEVARRTGKGNQIDIRGGDFPAPKTIGDYGLVYATITFECHIEQLVNFLADLSHQQELVVPSEERITSGQAKQKTVNVRMVLAGVVPKKLVPEKKGLGAF
ncbi:MAG TPA: hypothetical protein VHB50_11755 [Bryobacteraceae bacterium]|nr:hypothetical protein [Bryobacteraceae bacterium]